MSCEHAISTPGLHQLIASPQGVENSRYSVKSSKPSQAGPELQLTRTLAPGKDDSKDNKLEEAQIPLDCSFVQSQPWSHILETEAIERENASFPNAFVLLGFSEFLWLEMSLSAVVLVSYLLTLVGNSSIILLSLVDPRLQTPMYFFLDNLALLDLGLTCTIVPQLLDNLWGPDKTIAAWGCITQVFLFCWITSSECALLAMMAIDRYVAICRPLQYTLIMHPMVCMQMVAASWSSGLANALIQATLTLQLPLCGHHTLDHFFCEILVLIKLACGDTTTNELILTLMTIPFGMMPPLMVVISYIFIGRAVLKLPSAEGRHKALSTCSSHLLVVTLYFSIGIFLYLQPSAESSQAKFMSFFYCIITPLLNPLIYTLRNKDVKMAWNRILQSWSNVKSLKAQSLPVSFPTTGTYP
ncbi:Olfactory receptor 15 [Fukomys damarensis]|uniref:Olfactory receptor 15 n=1 Tax=Fukomys damarensis TaxID=885580 RepID=A0A091DBB7_FUKDA|nr:Olfactory receptor 15 [Fukomys damarensis]